eukprot:TRINITY_DN45769_c0_g2_i2.p1 TRINITY_DN45769_c0_g2~~TRINITY_DN45769_c0_g2_i2.p1  ORF type:complete len:75 (+),score=27.19 TRINITY_DN45769_c0_g2_i2:220-444(+)
MSDIEDPNIIDDDELEVVMMDPDDLDEEINNNNNNNKALQNRANRTESIAYLEDFFHRRPGVDNPNVVKFVGID